MATILRDGIRLTYEEHGAGDPAIVFVPGWTCDRSILALQAAHFAARHRVVSLDLRGHGESDKPSGEYSISDHADDVAYLIDRLGLGRVIAVGHSMGALIAVQLAAVHRDRVAAIVMVEPGPFALPPEARSAFEAIIAAIEAGNQQPREQLIRSLFLATSDSQLVERIVCAMLAAPEHVAAAELRGIVAFDGVAAAARCKAPALNLSGAAPFNPPHLMSQWLSGVVNGATVGAGHFNHLEVPDQVNAMIEEFMRHYVPRPVAV